MNAIAIGVFAMESIPDCISQPCGSRTSLGMGQEGDGEHGARRFRTKTEKCVDQQSEAEVEGVLSAKKASVMEQCAQDFEEGVGRETAAIFTASTLQGLEEVRPVRLC